MQYNPQIEFEITKLDEFGKEIIDPNDEFIKLSSKINGALENDYNNHSTNKPLELSISINKQLGNTQDSANITIWNHPLIEKIRANPLVVTRNLADNFYRIRIWAWHDDNAQFAQTVRPNMPPCYVGDILDGFSISADGVNDASITIQAQSHIWLATSGKMKKTWAAGANYGLVVTEIFTWFKTQRNYGFETFGAVQKSVIEAPNTLGTLQAKILKNSFTIDRNPMETLNDICRDLDLVWGFDNNIPYIIERKRFFAANELNEIGLNYQSDIRDTTGKIGVNQYGLFSFNASAVFDPSFIIGNLFVTFDDPQIDGQGSFGRIDSMSITLDTQNGHRSDISFSWVDGQLVRLPRRRDNTSGRALK